MTLVAKAYHHVEYDPRRYVFRVDASTQMGVGHLMRCLTLAGRLRDRGGFSHFICRDLPDLLCAQVKAAGYDLHKLPSASDFAGDQDGPNHAAWLGECWREDARQTVEVIDSVGNVDVLIVDHYAIDRRWEERARKHVRKICVIDDLADRPHDCDILLDQNHFANAVSRYRGLVPDHCQMLLGPGHALLREGFCRGAKRARERDGRINRVLIFYGGSDPDNLTGLTLNALMPFASSELRIDVVVGSINPNIALLRSAIDACSHCQIHVQTDNMAELMASADLAFGACGTATWERCAMGLPAIVAVLAQNQLEPTQALTEAGVVFNLGAACAVKNADLVDAFQLMISDQRRCLEMTMRARALMHTSELSVEEVLAPESSFSSGEVTLRYARVSDSGDLLLWRNQPVVRANSKTSAAIDPDQHARWLNGVLADPDRHLLIGCRLGEPIGVVRLDEHGNGGEVSLYLCPGAYGQGNGRFLLAALEEWVVKNRPSVTHLFAEVLEGNGASHQLFRNGGYIWCSTRYVKKVIK